MKIGDVTVQRSECAYGADCRGVESIEVHSLAGGDRLTIKGVTDTPGDGYYSYPAPRVCVACLMDALRNSYWRNSPAPIVEELTLEGARGAFAGLLPQAGE